MTERQKDRKTNASLQLSVHQHHLVLYALAGDVQQLLQPFHLSPTQCKYHHHENRLVSQFKENYILIFRNLSNNFCNESPNNFSGQIPKGAEVEACLLFQAKPVSRNNNSFKINNNLSFTSLWFYIRIRNLCVTLFPIRHSAHVA